MLLTIATWVPTPSAKAGYADLNFKAAVLADFSFPGKLKQ